MIWFSEHHIPLLWEYMGSYGFQPIIVNTLFLAYCLSKNSQFHEKSYKLIFWYLIESLWNQNQNIYYFSILWRVDSFEDMPDNL